MNKTFQLEKSLIFKHWSVITCGGSVGRLDARGPRFESSHRQTFISETFICLLSTVLKRRK